MQNYTYDANPYLRRTPRVRWKEQKTILMWLWIAGNIIDIFLTHEGLSRSIPEGNPLFIFLFAHFGFWIPIVGLKAIAVYVLYTIPESKIQIAWFPVAFLYLVAIIPWTITLYF